MRSRAAFVFLFTVLLSASAFADGQGSIPWVAVAIIYVLYGLLTIAVATAFCIVFRFLYERTRREKRRTWIWMVLCTIALPALFVWADSESTLFGDFRRIYGYEQRELLVHAIYCLLIFAGFNAGYFLTPKREAISVHSRLPKQKALAVLVQACAWGLVIGFLFYRGASRHFESLKKDITDEKAHISRQGDTLQYLKDVLDRHYKNVRWEHHFRLYKGQDEDGTVFNVLYDKDRGRYSMSYQIDDPPQMNDTLAWSDHALRLRHFLGPVRSQKLRDELALRSYTVETPVEGGNFAVIMHFPESGVELSYVHEMHIMLLRWKLDEELFRK